MVNQVQAQHQNLVLFHHIMSLSDNSATYTAAQAPYSVPQLTPHPDKLWVITGVFNSARYRSRYNLYRAFAKHMADSGVELITVECAFGTRPFEVTDAANPHHVQVRTEDELWLKENLFNIGLSRVPHGVKYVAVIDADCSFIRPDWAHETVQQLQHYPLVQMFASYINVGPEGEFLSNKLGFVESWKRGIPIVTYKGDVKSEIFWHRGRCAEHYTDAELAAMGHDPDETLAITRMKAGEVRAGFPGAPGLAWAYRREVIDALGGLMDNWILGSGDYYMAMALLGEFGSIVPPDYTQAFKDSGLAWQSRALNVVRKDFGCVPGVAVHHWHGKKQLRRYGLRNAILKKWQVDPTQDLRYGLSGVLQLVDDGTDRSAGLREDLRSYFAGRSEDSIEL